MQNGKISGSLEGINQETGKEDVRTSSLQPLVVYINNFNLLLFF